MTSPARGAALPEWKDNLCGMTVWCQQSKHLLVSDPVTRTVHPVNHPPGDPDSQRVVEAFGADPDICRQVAARTTQFLSDHPDVPARVIVESVARSLVIVFATLDEMFDLPADHCDWSQPLPETLTGPDDLGSLGLVLEDRFENRFPVDRRWLQAPVVDWAFTCAAAALREGMSPDS